MTVKAPAVEMASSKKAVAPSRLPFASRQNWADKSEKPALKIGEEVEPQLPFSPSGAQRRAEAPTNLPEADFAVAASKASANSPFISPEAKIKSMTQESVVNLEKNPAPVQSKNDSENKLERKNPEPPANLPMV